MNITVKATGITVGADSTAYLEQKIRSLEKYLDREDTTILAAVELGVETPRHQGGDRHFRAEVTLSHGGKVFRAEGEGSTLHAAIDAVEDRLGTELRRAKKKNESLMRRTGAMMKDAMRGFRPWPFRRRK